MRRFPLDVVTANNLAWVLALSDHRLEDALALSWRAVYLSPDSTVYRDTLAEILFRLGRVNEATTVARACLIDEPAEWHVHEQIRRFEAAAND
jgi:predicted Zn-dependent protease